MKKRSRLSKHDKAVLRSAKNYEGRGYNVKADLPGYKKPKTIGGYRPDLIAKTKNGKVEKILEIETRRSNEKDAEQQQAFRRYANRKKGRQFRKRVV